MYLAKLNEVLCFMNNAKQLYNLNIFCNEFDYSENFNAWW